MRYRAVIIEDETNARIALRNLLSEECPEVEIIGEAGSVQEGRVVLRELNPDLVFLDVNMPDGTSFELLEHYETTPFRIIFVTAHSEYAIKAIRYSALDYILKPIDRDELVAAVRRLDGMDTPEDQAAQVETLLKNQKKLERIALTTTEGIIFAKVKEVIRCEAESNYTNLFLTDQRKLVLSKTLKEMDEMLAGSGFYRIHKSHLVNLEHVDQFINAEGGYVQMVDGSRVEVARRRKEEFIDLLMSYHK